jgi:biopolymer transport protein ExbD
MFGKKKMEVKEVEVDLNRVVTPMLDMTFQILFFLIMNFHLPSPEGQVDLMLPKTDEAGKPQMAAEDKLDETKTDEYLLRLEVPDRGGDGEERQGLISGMSFRKKGDKITQAEPINRMDASNDKDDYFKALDSVMYGMVVKLREYQPKEGGAQPTIKLECPKKLKYSEMLRVMDVMRKMKFQNVGVIPMPKDG